LISLFCPAEETIPQEIAVGSSRKLGVDGRTVERVHR